MTKRLLLSALLSVMGCSAFAQADSLMNMLNDDKGVKKQKEYAIATFKATRLINGSTVQNLGAGVLDFRITHRFGDVNQGSRNFYGLDDATTMIGLDYGIRDWLMVGLAHSAFNKEDQGFAKVRLLRQEKHSMPITLSYYGAISTQTTVAPTNLPAGDTWKYSNRLFFANQILIARKFNDILSLQLMPTIIHYNLVDSNKFSNNTVALGVGGRIKLNKRFALTGEYYYRLSNTDLLVSGQKTYNSFSLGVDIETGGHVFQFMITNSQGQTERTFVGQTTDSWSKGALHIGFNISRVFTVVKPKEFRNVNPNDASKW